MNTDAETQSVGISQPSYGSLAKKRSKNAVTTSTNFTQQHLQQKNKMSSIDISPLFYTIRPTINYRKPTQNAHSHYSTNYNTQKFTKPT
jgi:hypothetical protein